MYELYRKNEEERNKNNDDKRKPNETPD